MANQSRDRSDVTFTTPSEVLNFVRDCLQTDDMDRLYDASDERTAEFWQQHIFDDLRAIEADESLEAVFLTEDTFPHGENEYTLGDHGDRTRCLHLDLVRQTGRWRLKTIWKCR